MSQQPHSSVVCYFVSLCGPLPVRFFPELLLDSRIGRLPSHEISCRAWKYHSNGAMKPDKSQKFLSSFATKSDTRSLQTIRRNARMFNCYFRRKISPNKESESLSASRQTDPRLPLQRYAGALVMGPGGSSGRRSSTGQFCCRQALVLAGGIDVR
jgi:hypothetical protein